MRKFPLLLALTIGIGSFRAVAFLEKLPQQTWSIPFPRQEVISNPVEQPYFLGITVPLSDQSPSLPPPVDSDSSEADSLIAWRLEHLVYIGVSVLAIGTILVTGLLSQRIEHAIVFALILSAILIAILWHL